MLLDVALLEIFDFYLHTTSCIMGYAFARVLKMVKCYFWITTSPQVATSMHRARITSFWLPSITIVYIVWISGMVSTSKFAARKHLASHAVAIPGADRSDLRLDLKDETAIVIPASFLGRSAPRLESLILNRIPFPGLPNLLSSATDLIYLNLQENPHSGYISPHVMAICLSMLTRLEVLNIGFKSLQCRPDWRCLLPQTRVPLPLLIELSFQGVAEYLEDLVAQIDAPLLDHLMINFFHQLVFDTLQLTQFIGRTRTPNFTTHDRAHVVFSDNNAWVTLPVNSGMQLVLPSSSHFWGGRPLYPGGQIFATALARQYR
jgi:hypothetical protein